MGERGKGERASRAAVGFLMGPLQLLVSVPEAGKEPSGTGIWGVGVSRIIHSLA